MLGIKFYKNNYDLDAYSAAAEWCNNNNAMIVDEGEYYEVVAIPPPSLEEINEAEIQQLKAELSATDYKCLKYVDGAISESEYAEVKAYRAELRQKINELQRTE